MKSVFKYVVLPDEPVVMPRGAEIILVGTQIDPTVARPDGTTKMLAGEQVCVWAIVDKSANAPAVYRLLRAFGTGHNLAPGAKRENYIGSAVFKTMPLVFHVFDLGERDLDPTAS